MTSPIAIDRQASGPGGELADLPEIPVLEPIRKKCVVMDFPVFCDCGYIVDFRNEGRKR